jgi:hypothetical protein
MVENGEKIKAGKVLVKIPRRSSKSGDITEVYLELQIEARNLQTQLLFLKSMVLFWKNQEVTVRLLSNLNLVTLENTWLNYQILVQEMTL